MLMGHSPLLFVGFIIFVLAILAFDLGLLNRKQKEVSTRRALIQSLCYFLLALAFSGGVYHYMSPTKAYEFITGYLVEISLSVDNIFVFLLIFSHFKVPPQYQHRVLFWGIMGALILRGTLIGAGVALIHQFEWLLYVFAIFLIYTGIKIITSNDAPDDLQDNKIIKSLRKYLRITNEFHEERFTVVKNGVRWFTPMFVVLVLLELSDVMFALDSIPAIFAITQDPFIIFTSNIFAILGLRSLYFAVAGILHRFEFMKYGLSLVLILIGSKMFINEIFGKVIISIEVALGMTVLILGGSIVMSIIKTRGKAMPKDPKDIPMPIHHHVPGSSKQSDDASE